MRDIRIACGQFVAEPGNKRSNVARMIAYAQEARDEGCELILFPELIVTGYLPPEQVLPLVEPLSGPSVQALAQTARDLGIAIAFGLAEVRPRTDEREGVRYNSLVILDRRGQVVAVYHKMHLWATEKEWAEPGREVLAFEMGGLRYGGWICYDTRFPELARLGALAGVDVGLVSTAWLGPGEEWELALRARALDNSMFVAGADIISPNPALRCHGLSMIVGPKGNVLARAEPEQEGIICATLSQAVLDAQRRRVPLLEDRRPELYGRLTVREFASLDVRPYHLMHIVSKIGQGCTDDLGDPRLNEILKAVRENPALPLTLRCNVTATYAYQNPGPDEDTAEGDLHNVRRDLKILQRMGLVPGATRPAIDLFERLLRDVEAAEGILWFDEVTSDAWRGEPREECHYEAGRALGLGAILHLRSGKEMARVKRESAQATYEADLLEIRPHHLMCMTCFYGGREELAPIDEDNLYEAIDAIHKDPEIPIRLICGPCMICPPCPSYHPPSGLCIGGQSMSLRDELKDLDVLQRLGLRYGDVLPARELLTRLYDRIASTREICGHGDGLERSPEWRVCGGPDGDPRYAKGRAAGLGFLDR